MKNLLTLILNLIFYYVYSITDLFGILWYGKLPKVSMFHRVNGDFSINEIYNDEFAQSRGKWNTLNKRTVLSILYDVVLKSGELPKSIPIRDEKGKELGTQGLYTYLEKIFKEKMKDYKD